MDSSSKNSKIQLLYDQQVCYLDLYLEETNQQTKEISASLCSLCLFTTAKTWKQPKFPLTG